jgi:hypothetical protein
MRDFGGVEFPQDCSPSDNTQETLASGNPKRGCRPKKPVLLAFGKVKIKAWDQAGVTPPRRATESRWATTQGTKEISSMTAVTRILNATEQRDHMADD